MSRRGLLIILSSPSGAGKSTLAGRLRAWDDTLQFSVSATTRQPRAGEVDGKDYYFVSPERFEEMVRTGEMLPEINSTSRTSNANITAILRSLRFSDCSSI